MHTFFFYGIMLDVLRYYALLSPKKFVTLPKPKFKFQFTFILSSACALNLDQSKTLSFGKELRGFAYLLHILHSNVIPLFLCYFTSALILKVTKLSNYQTLVCCTDYALQCPFMVGADNEIHVLLQLHVLPRSLRTPF